MITTTIENPETTETALDACLRQSGLNWTVRKEPLFLADGRQTPDGFATIRQDTGQILGVVGGRYTPVQNADAFAAFSVFDELTWVTGETYHGGSVICVQAELAGASFTLPGGDFVQSKVFFRNSHDGKTKVVLSPTSVRIICENTLAMATREARTTPLALFARHTSSVTENIKTHARMLAQVYKASTMSREIAETLASRPVSVAVVEEFLNQTFPLGEDLTERVTRNVIAKREAVETLFDGTGLGSELASARGTAWGLVNAYTEWIDHHAGTARTTEETRRYNAWFGEEAEEKLEAQELLLTLTA